MKEVKRKRGESFESLMRRYRKQVQTSGSLLQAKKVQYHKRGKSKNLQRASALLRLQKAAKRAYLQKIGMLPAEPQSTKR